MTHCALLCRWCNDISLWSVTLVRYFGLLLWSVTLGTVRVHPARGPCGTHRRRTREECHNNWCLRFSGRQCSAQVRLLLMFSCGSASCMLCILFLKFSFLKRSIGGRHELLFVCVAGKMEAPAQTRHSDTSLLCSLQKMASTSCYAA